MKFLRNFSGDLRNIVFDFGGVIMDIDLQRTINAFQALGMKGVTVEDTQAGSGTFFDLNEQGKISPEEFLEKLRAHLPNGDSVPAGKIWAAWDALLGEFVPARMELIRELRKTYKVFLLSNTNAPHRKTFHKIFAQQIGGDLDAVFDQAFYSDVLGFVKPDPRIYDAVTKQAGIVPAETLFIDDNVKNIAGAQACGWRGYHLQVGKETILDLFA